MRSRSNANIELLRQFILILMQLTFLVELNSFSGVKIKFPPPCTKVEYKHVIGHQSSHETRGCWGDSKSFVFLLPTQTDQPSSET